MPLPLLPQVDFTKKLFYTSAINRKVLINYLYQFDLTGNLLSNFTTTLALGSFQLDPSSGLIYAGTPSDKMSSHDT